MDDEELVIMPIRSTFKDIANALREVYDDPEIEVAPNEIADYVADIPEQGAGGQTDATTIIKGTVRKVLNTTATFVKSYTFAFCSSLTTVTLPEASKIGESVFESCPKLRGLSFPKCEFIDNYAFIYCTGLSKISFPECISINSYAFSGCSSLYSLYLPKCEYINTGAFQNCSISELSLPAVKMISGNAFTGTNNRIDVISFPNC